MKASKVIPSRLLITILLVVAIATLLGYLLGLEFAGTTGAIALLSLFIVSLVDLTSAREAPELTLERQIPLNLSLNRWTKVGVTVRSNIKPQRKARLFDEIDATFDCKQLPVKLELSAGVPTQIAYEIKPQKRGSVTIASAQIMIESAWHLWNGIFHPECESKLRVFPDFSTIRDYVLLTTSNHSAQLGIKKRLQRGEGTEFNSLREYRKGDTLRQVNWKATSKFRKLISQDHHHESDQQIVVLLDSGRRMLTRDEGLSHFDQALNALILVGYIALRMGDAIGVLSFGKESRWIAPGKGAQQNTNILNNLYDLHADTAASDYEEAITEFLSHQKKRCLVIVLTNLRDENMDGLISGLKLLRGKHAMLVANIQETIIGNQLRKEIDSLDDALSYCGMQQYLADSRKSQQTLTANGIFNFTCTGPALAPTLANSYLEIKGAGIL